MSTVIKNDCKIVQKIQNNTNNCNPTKPPKANLSHEVLTFSETGVYKLSGRAMVNCSSKSVILLLYANIRRMKTEIANAIVIEIAIDLAVEKRGTGTANG